MSLIASYRWLMSRIYRRKNILLVSFAVSSTLWIAFHVYSARADSQTTNRKPFSRELRPSRDHVIYQDQPQPPQPLHALSSDARAFIPQRRLVHLDLKGAPPKISYYAQLFPLLAALGANGLLLEYEDTFPFEGQLSAARAGNAYSHADIDEILRLATDNALEVIPLVQTFGHLEFLLKLEEFSFAREVNSLPQAICPSRNSSFDLIRAIIDQMVEKHPKSRFIHIGCDEVFHMGYCDACRLQDRDVLFLAHVKRVSEYVVTRHARIPIIWDDMLRQISSERIRESRISELGVEIMVWTYVKDIYRFIPFSQWSSFAQLFPHVWTASAFKGAFGETLTVPNARWHLDNNLAWLEVMSEQKSSFKDIRGLVLTGWQRYDHLATLCELLPAALPSLALSLLSVTFGHFSPKDVFSRFNRLMTCDQSLNNDVTRDTHVSVVDALAALEADPGMFSRAGNCRFPGSSVHRLMQTHAEVIKRVDEYLYDVTIHKAWLTDYNERHNISSPYRVDEGLQDYSSVYYSLQSLLRSAREALSEVYDKHTVSEWTEQNIYPYLLRMEALMNRTRDLKNARVWPRRPLRAPEDLERRLKATDFN